MRYVFFAIALAMPVSASARERMLDASRRAQLEGWKYTRSTTASEFRKMRRHHRPEDFALWTGKLKLLREGMTDKQILEMLKPKEFIPDQIVHNGATVDTILLDDAYYVGVMFDERRRRMIWTTPPIAITYDVESK